MFETLTYSSYIKVIYIAISKSYITYCSYKALTVL